MAAGGPEAAPQPSEVIDQPQQYQLIDGRIDTAVNLEPGETITPLKVVFAGKGAMGNSFFDAVQGSVHEIVEVYGPAVTKKNPVLDPIRQKAKDLGITENKFSSLDDPAELKRLEEDVKPDVIIGANLTLFVKPELAKIAKLGMWGSHFSNLIESQHRGANATQWQFVNGAEEVYLSLHALGRDDEMDDPDGTEPEEGPLPKGSVNDPENDTADKGPVLAMTKIDRSAGPRAHSAFFSQQLLVKGPEFMVQVLNMMSKAKDQGIIYTGQRQIRGRGNYQPPMNKDHLRISPEETALEAQHKVEAGTGNPGAYIVMESGAEYTIYDATAQDAESTKPGTLSSITEDAVNLDMKKGKLNVRTMRSGVITRIGDVVSETDKTKPQPSPLFASERNLAPGDYFVAPQLQ